MRTIILGCFVVAQLPLEGDMPTRSSGPGPARKRLTTDAAASDFLAGSPVFLCPHCDGPLEYVASRDEGAGQNSEWFDQYTCSAGCGTFEYVRHTHRVHVATARA